MNRRVTFFAVIEAIILLFLLVALFRNGFIFFFGLSLLFTWVARRSNNRAFAIVSAIFWLITAIQILRSGYFWLAVAFPIVLLMVIYKRRNLNSNASQQQVFRQNFSENPTNSASNNNREVASENELIDLADMHFHASGNNLSIRKNFGNTKIIVPKDVELALNITVRKGIVNVLGKMTEINDVQIRYFTDNYESAEKRVAIMIKVDNGNVDIIRDL